MTEPPTGIALPSDQDSTEGDESEYDIGMIIYINKSNCYLDVLCIYIISTSLLSTAR